MLLMTSSTTVIIYTRHLFSKLEVLKNRKVYSKSVVFQPPGFPALPSDCSAISLFFKILLSLFSGSFPQVLMGKSVSLTSLSPVSSVLSPSFPWVS